LSGIGIEPPALAAKSSTAYRGLLAAVILLGVLIVIALGVLVVGLVTHFTGGGHRQAANAPAQFALAPGMRLVATDVAADRLILHLRGASGEEIDIIDTQNGRLVAKIRASAPPPK
jgi:hypothetical protein